MLFNVGFLEAKKLYDYDCFVFHDVDLIPEDDRNLYSCPLEPRHMSVAIDDQGYKYVPPSKSSTLHCCFLRSFLVFFYNCPLVFRGTSASMKFRRIDSSCL